MDIDVSRDMIISHITRRSENESDWSFQSNKEHQEGVAKRASAFASEFNMADWGRVLGLLHDKGKEQKSFQEYIRKVSEYQSEITVEGNHDHAYVGGLIAKKLFPQCHPFLDNAIMGHHRGLYDDGDLCEMLKRSIPDEVKINNIETQLKLPSKEYHPEDVHHIERMLFSCLVDADYLDTEAFMMPEQAKQRGHTSSLEELYRRLLSYLAKLKSEAPDTSVNQIRNYIQKRCYDTAGGPVDFYSLTVPTGGGKTLSSILWALRHAIKNHLNRIIIAIPYTSIIVQTAAVLKQIFGVENVLEHHSDRNDDDIKDSKLKQKLKLASENWDYPIIVTTNVQLFESLFSNKPSACRKLHNIVRSVIILDEVQTLPMDFLQPIVDTLGTLNRIFDTTILFTTASMPVLTGKITGTTLNSRFKGLSEIHEIIPESVHLYDKLRRVKLDIDDTPKSYDEIANQLSRFDRVLCVVNTRKDAKELYDRLPKEGVRLHLSRMMCSEHVKETIEELKKDLKNDQIPVLRVISTQLIEAGVDIDFPVVFRQQAGLDSILQAAGRCNREGHLGIGITHVFSLQKEHNLPPGFMTQTNNARLGMGSTYDWFAPKAMTDYFYQLYSRIQTFDKKQMSRLLYTQQMQMEEAAKNFHLIDDQATPVIVNWKDSMELTERLKSEGPTYTMMKKLSQFQVNVREKDMKALQSLGALEEIIENVYVVKEKSFYDDNIGLNINNKWLEETYII